MFSPQAIAWSQYQPERERNAAVEWVGRQSYFNIPYQVYDIIIMNRLTVEERVTGGGGGRGKGVWQGGRALFNKD